MPELICLREARPLAQIVAAWLLSQSKSPIKDLSNTVVLVPTAGAARRLKAALVEQSADTGLLSPRIAAPMQFLAENSPTGTATRFDCLVAWTQVIEEMEEIEFENLFPGFASGSLRMSAPRIAATLMSLTDLLAEAGRSPDAPELQKLFPEDDRWPEIAELFGRVRDKLAAAHLTEVNAALIRTSRSGQAPAEIKEIVVAGVPDLTPLLQGFLKNLSTQGIRVVLLVHTPDCEDGVFDQWGRPDPDHWKTHILPISDEIIIPCESPDVEAGTAATFVQSSGQSAGMVLADPTLAPLMERAFEQKGMSTYDPSGVPLSSSPPALILREWPVFCRTGSLSSLRLLAETPLFLDHLASDDPHRAKSILEDLDFFAHSLIRDTLPSERELSHLDPRRDRPETFLSRLLILIRNIDHLRRTFHPEHSPDALPRLLTALYAQKKIPANSPEALALTELSSHIQALLSSPLQSDVPRHDLLQHEVAKARYFLPKPAGCIELHGWLEASWLDAPHLILCGCTEGNVPGVVDGHPFLPDQARQRLGISSNDQRFARDIYLAHCLLAVRLPESVRILFSQTGVEGDPNRASRLLFRCPDAQLAQRVQRLQHPLTAPTEKPPAERVWALRLPQKSPPVSLRVTGFKEYLQCPVRFYLKNLLRMQPIDSQKAEMDAADYGTVMHEVMENFANHQPVVHSRNPKEIEDFILEELDRVLSSVFGGIHSVALRAQRESLRARLRRFAFLQAEERRNGWRIVAAEEPFKAEDTLSIGPLKITAKLDRIEINENTGQRRILDYKSFNQLKTPEKTHLSSSRTPPIIDAATTGDGRQWVDLQLPLYRALAEHRWPQDSQPPLVGYFLLPPKIEDSAIELLPLDEARYESALTCARDIAERVSRGVFWPPAENLRFDDFSPLFPVGKESEAFDPESIAFLKGERP